MKAFHKPCYIRGFILFLHGKAKAYNSFHCQKINWGINSWINSWINNQSGNGCCFLWTTIIQNVNKNANSFIISGTVPEESWTPSQASQQEMSAYRAEVLTLHPTKKPYIQSKFRAQIEDWPRNFDPWISGESTTLSR